jgi:hypothetical protein
MPNVSAKIATNGAKITSHFIAPVNKNCISAGLEATNKLTIMLLATAKNMLL